MLSEAIYLEKLADIMAWYVNFKFKVYDIDSNGKKQQSLQYTTWYKAFKDFSDEDFSSMVDGYMEENVYPPSSPTSLLEYANKVLIVDQRINVERAWSTLKDLIVKDGFNGYKTYSSIQKEYVTHYPLEYNIKKYGDTLLNQVFQEMYSELKAMNSNNEQWVRKAFFERYNELLTQKIKDGVKVGKIALNGDKKMIE